jgi:hypothetical protein
MISKKSRARRLWLICFDAPEEKREALQAWSRHVLALVEGTPGNVVLLKRK